MPYTACSLSHQRQGIVKIKRAEIIDCGQMSHKFFVKTFFSMVSVSFSATKLGEDQKKEKEKMGLALNIISFFSLCFLFWVSAAGTTTPDCGLVWLRPFEPAARKLHTLGVRYGLRITTRPQPYLAQRCYLLGEIRFKLLITGHCSKNSILNSNNEIFY